MMYFMEELGLRRLQLTKLMKEHSRMLGLSVDNKLRLNVRASREGQWPNAPMPPG